MNQLTLWRLASALLALALLFAISQATGPDRWVEAQAQNRARELAEIETFDRFQPEKETVNAWLERLRKRREAREQLCQQRTGQAPVSHSGMF